MMTVFLTCAQYDALLPLPAAKLAAYKRAKRTWTIEGVRLVLTLADARVLGVVK